MPHHVKCLKTINLYQFHYDFVFEAINLVPICFITSSTGKMLFLIRYAQLLSSFSCVIVFTANGGGGFLSEINADGERKFFALTISGGIGRRVKKYNMSLAKNKTKSLKFVKKSKRGNF